MDVRIREAVQADAGAMARVHIDMWRTAYAGIVPDEHLAGLSYERREAVWVQILSRDEPAQCNFVAETVGGEIVGFAGGGPEREGDSTTGASSTPYTCSRSTSAEELDAA